MARGRKPIKDRLCIQVDADHVVMVDAYNLILSEIYKLPDKVLPQEPRFYSTFPYLISQLHDHGISTESINKFQERVKNFQTNYINGQLIVTAPPGFVSDPIPFGKIED